MEINDQLKDKLLKKISEHKLTVGIVGLGYVGLPLAVEMAKSGFKTIGLDVQKSKVDKVNSGKNYIGDINDSEFSELINNHLLSATTEFKVIKDIDFIAICVPTPLDAHQQPDISFIETSVKEIAKYLAPETMIVLESTTYPGTTEELIKPILENGSGLKCSKDFYLGFSPERVDPGNAHFKTKNTPKVVGAIGAAACETISAVYAEILGNKIHTVSSPAVAEMTKILENTYRNVNIGLINELAIMANRMNIDIWEVIEAAKSKPFGFTAFYPGPGLGGHCIPLDPYYLSWKAREYNFHTTMIESSMIINDRMPLYVVERCGLALNRLKKALNGAKILTLGIAYKQDINDYRESPALRVIDELEKVGSNVIYYDSYIAEYIYKGKSHKSQKSLTTQLLESMDIVIIVTAHSNVDYNFIQRHSKMIFDTKNAMKNILDRNNIEVL